MESTGTGSSVGFGAFPGSGTVAPNCVIHIMFMMGLTIIRQQRDDLLLCKNKHKDGYL